MFYSAIIILYFFLYTRVTGIGYDDKELHVIKNVRGLFDAAVRNESKIVIKFVEALKKSEERLEEAYNTLNDAIKSSLSNYKHCHQSTERINITKREAAAEAFNYEKAFTQLEGELVKLNSDEKIEHLKKRVVDEEEEVFRLATVIGGIWNQRQNELVYKLILVVHTQIELFENELLPTHFKQATSRYSRWVIILNSGDPEAEPILSRVLSFYNTGSRKGAIETFARALQRICGDLSDRPNKIFSKEILEILQNDNERRKQVLDELKVPTDEKYTKAIEVIVVELKYVGRKDKKANNNNLGLNNLKCVVIFPAQDKSGFRDGKHEDDDVYMFFPTVKPEKVDFKKGDKTFADSFIVHFEDVFASIDAIDNNLGWLKGQKVVLRLEQCCG